MNTEKPNTTTRCHVSLPRQMWLFARSHGYSLSKLLQIKIIEIMKKAESPKQGEEGREYE